MCALCHLINHRIPTGLRHCGWQPQSKEIKSTFPDTISRLHQQLKRLVLKRMTQD